MSREIPNFIRDKDVIIASSYRRKNHFDEVLLASRIFESIGLNVYPPHNSEPIDLGNFVFLAGLGYEGLTKLKIERSFLEAIKRARLLFVLSTSSYLGHSASIETAYGLAVGTPVLVSKPISIFGGEVPPNLKAIIHKYHPPVVSLKEAEELGPGIFDFARKNGNFPHLKHEERRVIFSAVLNLARTLRSD